MSTIVTSIEGKGGQDDTVKVVKDGVETNFESVEDAARFIGVDEDWLEEHLDNAGYDEPIDVDELQDEEEAEAEEDEESSKSE